MWGRWGVFYCEGGIVIWAMHGDSGHCWNWKQKFYCPTSSGGREYAVRANEWAQRSEQANEWAQWSAHNQDKTRKRQDKTRQDKTRQDKKDKKYTFSADKSNFVSCFGFLYNERLHLLSIFSCISCFIDRTPDPSDPLQSTYIQSGAKQCWKEKSFILSEYFVTEVTLKVPSMTAKIVE